jgi:predicted molibdopterin-dependent oxidoreductase YjgC
MDGEITDVIPCKTHLISEGKLCVLGRNSFRYIRNKDRLTKPLIRSGNGFVEASWEEALDKAAKEFLRIKQSAGPESLGVFSSAKCTNEENYVIMKFARGVLGTNNVDHCARL